MKKRVFLLLVILTITTPTAYYFFSPNPKKITKKALFQLRQKDFASAELTLKSLSSSLPVHMEALYRGYLEQIRARSTFSERFFQNAYQEAQKNNCTDMIPEILLARALNAYSEERNADFFSCVEDASRLNAQNPGLRLFEGLKCYLQKDYAEALSLWEHYSPSEVGEWMALSLEQLFSQIKLDLHKAHCQIEQGDIFKGREILDNILQRTDQPKQTLPIATLFLGLSYLKEAHKFPYDQRATFYNMASFYFERAQVGSCTERKLVISHLEQETEYLIKRLCFQSFDFIHILEQWNAHFSISSLAHVLAEKITYQTHEECLCFCEALRKEFMGTSFYNQLTEEMLTTLASSLKRGELENLFQLWTLIESLHPNSKQAARELASLTSEEIFETIKKDTLSLVWTRNYLDFWEKLGRSDAEREALARALLYHAKLFWQNEKQEKKGLRLMEIALTLSNQNVFIEKEIASFLTNLYAQAENSNMIRRLSLIYDAMARFAMNRQELISKAALANHLADAEYLYQVHNYPTAKTHACWVLKIDPDNEGARRLVGLCSFNLGEYDKALCHLQELRHPDEDAQKALMLSQVFATQEQRKHLCQTEIMDSFEETN